jgi:hypothetical protein
MNREEAKRILWLYRGGIDADDPAFAEALQTAERDPQLALWLKDHLAAYASIRAQLKGGTGPARTHAENPRVASCRVVAQTRLPTGRVALHPRRPSASFG